MAHLANIPESVLQLAAVKSKALEDVAVEKTLEYMYVCMKLSLAFLILYRSRCFSLMLEQSSMNEIDQVIAGIEQL